MSQGQEVLLSSVKNPRVRSLLDLGEAKHRHQTGLFALEGAREIGRALAAGFSLTELFICAERLSEASSQVLASLPLHGSIRRYDITAALFEKIAVRHGQDGLVAVLVQRNAALDTVTLGPAPLILALQGIEKPGNIGALLRTADGAKADLVVVLDRSLDLFHPHVLRTSLGTCFSMPTVGATSAAFLAFCQQRHLAVYAAALTKTSKLYTDADYRGGSVLLLGEEAGGLTADWLQSSICIKVPMLGVADSLNVAAAGAVLLYEARRQRGIS